MNWKYVVGIIGASLLVLGGVVWLLSKQSQQGEVVDKQVVVGEARHIRGEGQITVVEFSDFQCPACRGAEPEVKRLIDKYQGQIRLVYRHFPLSSIHKRAEIAAEAAEAAGKQGKFWEYHDLLFARQDEWVGAKKVEEKLVSYAKELGLDEKKFQQDMMSKEVKQIVQKDRQTAWRLGLSGTPSFFVEGKEVSLGELEMTVRDFLR